MIEEGNDSSYEVSEKNTHEISEGQSLAAGQESFDKNNRVLKKKDLERLEKRKEMEQFITDSFDYVSRMSQLKVLNSLTPEKRTETFVYNFDESMRYEFLLFALSYGLNYESIEQLWREFLIYRIKQFNK